MRWGPGSLLTRSSRGLRVASVLWAGGAVPVLSGIICPGIDWGWCGLMVLLTTSKMISPASWTRVTTQSESSWQVNHKNHARCSWQGPMMGGVRCAIYHDIRALQSIASQVTSLLRPPDWEPALLVCVCRPESGRGLAMWQCGKIPSKWVLALLIPTNLILCPAPASPRPCKQS